MIEGRAQDDKQEQSEGDGKPLAAKLMEDCVMITVEQWMDVCVRVWACIFVCQEYGEIQGLRGKCEWRKCDVELWVEVKQRKYV